MSGVDFVGYLIVLVARAALGLLAAWMLIVLAMGPP